MDLEAELAARYGPIVGFAPMRQSQNAVYAGELAGRAVVFRIAPPGHRSGKEVDAELDFIRYLGARSALVCPPVALADGALRGILEDGSIVCCFDRAEGRHPSIGDAADIELFARGMVQLHGLSRARTEALDRKNAVEDPFFAIEPDAPEEVELRDWLQDLPRDAGRFGLIHGDYNTGNALIADGALKVFDFDDCAYHWYEYEVANTLYMVIFALRGRDDLGEFRYFRDGLLAGLDARVYRRAYIGRFIEYRVALLAQWIRRPERGPLFIREMTPDWERELRAFIAWFATHRREVL